MQIEYLPLGYGTTNNRSGQLSVAPCEIIGAQCGFAADQNLEKRQYQLHIPLEGNI